MNFSDLDLSILTQVVYKEHCAFRRLFPEKKLNIDEVVSETLILARCISTVRIKYKTAMAEAMKTPVDKLAGQDKENIESFNQDLNN